MVNSVVMRESSLVVIFEVCALYTAVLLGQIEDVCIWCLHSAHLWYTDTHRHTHKTQHTCAVTYSVVVFSINGSFVAFKKNSHDRLPSGCQRHSHVSLRVNADEQQGMKAEVHKRTLHTVKNTV